MTVDEIRKERQAELEAIYHTIFRLLPDEETEIYSVDVLKQIQPELQGAAKQALLRRIGTVFHELEARKMVSSELRRGPTGVRRYYKKLYSLP